MVTVKDSSDPATGRVVLPPVTTHPVWPLVVAVMVLTLPISTILGDAEMSGGVVGAALQLLLTVLHEPSMHV